MRQLRSFVLLTVLTVGALGLASSEARAQWYNYSYGVPGAYYSSPYVYTAPGFAYSYTAPYTYGYAYPGYSYSAPGYYWSADRYYTPYTQGWNYQAYSPWTNQYRYSYGVRPRWR